MLAPLRYRGITPYVFGLLGVIVATLLRHLSDPFLGEHLSLSFHFLAVFFAAWTGGLWPAVFTSALSAIVGNLLFTDPHLSLRITSREELLELMFFLVVSVIIGGLSEISLRALTRAKQAEREKDNFMAALAHEMRSPLSVIYYASTMSRAGGSKVEPNEQLDIIDRQVHHLNLMIEDLLDVSRVTRGKITLRRKQVQLSEIVAGAVERARPMIEAHQHMLSVQLPSQPTQLYADPVRMEQVLANLLTNAAKYTPDGGEIVVRGYVDGDKVILSVRDNGIGITPEMLPRVFDLFVQADSARERSHGGLGIGLALARKIAEMHGGSVEAISEGLDHGSEFVVAMPLAKPAESRAALARV